MKNMWCRKTVFMFFFFRNLTPIKRKLLKVLKIEQIYNVSPLNETQNQQRSATEL